MRAASVWFPRWLRSWAGFLGGELWSNPDFVKFWTGQSISRLGTRITVLALPTAAIQYVGAGPFEVGLLTALQSLPFLVLGLPAGVLADRVGRRPLLILCDAGRLLALASVPLAFVVHRLTLGQLYAVALVVGLCTTLFEVTYQAYLPALVERGDLVEGNAKLEMSNSVTVVAGPAVGGGLIQLLRAPLAILADCGSYIASIATLLMIGRRAPAPERAQGPAPSILRDLAEGVRIVLGDRILLLIGASSATANLGNQMAQAAYLLYAYKELGLSPGLTGLVLGIGSVGSLFGAAAVYPAARALGVGRALVLSLLLAFASYLLLPVARLGAAVSILVAASFVLNFGLPIYNVNTLTIRQAIVPLHLQGRVVGTIRTVVIGAIPVGGLLGGLIGSHAGLVAALVSGSVVGMLSAVWILAGPVRMRTVPAPA